MSGAESPAATTTVGAALAETLARSGIKLAFTVPGESIVGVLEGLAERRVRVVAARHEGAAAFMAGAVGQLTGRPAVVLAGRSPGASNLMIGLDAAQSDSAPVVAIVGQVRREVRGRGAFQEMDLAAAFGPVVKWVAEAREPEEVVGLAERAVATAVRGRPGPVLLSVPEDVLEAEIPVGPQRRAFHPGHPVEPDPVLVREALHLLLDAERPLILAGAGVLRARSTDALVRFAELVHTPVVASWRRGDVFPNDNPLYLGATGLGSPACVRERLEHADGLLVLGSRLGEFTSYGYSIPAEGTRWAQVDLEPTAAGPGGQRPNLAVAADVGAFLRVATRVAAGGVLEMAGLERRMAQNAADRVAFEASAVTGTEAWAGPGIHPGKVIASLLATLPPEAILTSDAGDFGTWAARGYRFCRPGTFLGPTSGAMGYGLPAAVAASLARPGRTAVALAGDGGFAMSMAELETAVRERAHVIVLVFDNGRYGTVWRHQAAQASAPGLATRLGQIDFAAVAGACGALGLTVGTDEEFEPALQQALEAGRPALLHLVLDPRWTTPDVIPSAEDLVPEEARRQEAVVQAEAPEPEPEAVEAEAEIVPPAAGGLWDSAETGPSEPSEPAEQGGRPVAGH